MAAPRPTRLNALANAALLPLAHASRQACRLTILCLRPFCNECLRPDRWRVRPASTRCARGCVFHA
eukprot:5105263-Pleurochrysis_carterae.AAC.1